MTCAALLAAIILTLGVAIAAALAILAEPAVRQARAARRRHP